MDNNENISDAEVVETEVDQEVKEVKGESLKQRFSAWFNSFSKIWQGIIALIALVILFAILSVMLRIDFLPVLVIIFSINLVRVIGRRAGTAAGVIITTILIYALIALLLPGARTFIDGNYFSVNNLLYKNSENNAQSEKDDREKFNDKMEKKNKSKNDLYAAGKDSLALKMSGEMVKEREEFENLMDSIYHPKSKEQLQLQEVKNVNYQPTNEFSTTQPINNQSVNNDRSFVEKLGNDTYLIHLVDSREFDTKIRVNPGDKLHYYNPTGPYTVCSMNRVYDGDITFTVKGTKKNQKVYVGGAGIGSCDLYLKIKRK